MTILLYPNQPVSAALRHINAASLLRPALMPVTTRNAMIDKALLGNVRSAPKLALSPLPLLAETGLPVDKDVYCVMPGGTAHVLSKSVNKLSGRRNRYDLHFCTMPGASQERQRVISCGCTGWYTSDACRHALALDTLINAPYLTEILTLCGGEICWAYEAEQSCRVCGAGYDADRGVWPVKRVQAHQPRPLPGCHGRGYDQSHYCEACGERRVI